VALTTEKRVGEATQRWDKTDFEKQNGKGKVERTQQTGPENLHEVKQDQQEHNLHGRTIGGNVKDSNTILIYSGLRVLPMPFLKAQNYPGLIGVYWPESQSVAQ